MHMGYYLIKKFDCWKMTDRVNKCFNCGNEGHFARECTESNNCFIQPERPDRLENQEKIGKEITEEVPATTAEKAVISQEIAKHLLKKEPDVLIANKTVTEEEVVVEIWLATIAKRLVTLPRTALQVRHKFIQERELSAITARRRDILLVNVLNKKNLATRKLNAITAIKPAIWLVLAPQDLAPAPEVSVEDLLSVIIVTKPVILRRLALVKVILLRPEGVILPIYHACKMQKNILYIIYHVNVGLL